MRRLPPTVGGRGHQQGRPIQSEGCGLRLPVLHEPAGAVQRRCHHRHHRLQPVPGLAIQESEPVAQGRHEPGGRQELSRRDLGQPEQPQHGAGPAHPAEPALPADRPGHRDCQAARQGDQHRAGHERDHRRLGGHHQRTGPRRAAPSLPGESGDSHEVTGESSPSRVSKSVDRPGAEAVSSAPGAGRIRAAASLGAASVRAAASWPVRQATTSFVLPAVLLLFFLSIFPLLVSAYLSLTRFLFVPGGFALRWVGLANYRKLVVGITVQYWLGLWLAFLCAQEVAGRRFFRVIFLLPMMITPVGIAYTFRILMDLGKGPFAPVWRALGLAEVSWANYAWGARLVVMIGDIWQWTPFMFIVLLAALESLPAELIEAARVDGASRWQVFWRISWPQLIPVTSTLILIRMIEAFKIIDMPNVLTNGGPGTATESLTLHAFMSWRTLDIGGSAAVAYMLLFVVAFAALSYTNLAHRRLAEAA